MKADKQSSVEVSAHDWDVLRQCRPEDFDGHTGFARMTPAARLEWLDAAVQFVSEAKHGARGAEKSQYKVSEGKDEGDGY